MQCVACHGAGRVFSHAGTTRAAPHPGIRGPGHCPLHSPQRITATAQVTEDAPGRCRRRRRSCRGRGFVLVKGDGQAMVALVRGQCGLERPAAPVQHGLRIRARGHTKLSDRGQAKDARPLSTLDGSSSARSVLGLGSRYDSPDEQQVVLEGAASRRRCCRHGGADGWRRWFAAACRPAARRDQAIRLDRCMVGLR